MTIYLQCSERKQVLMLFKWVLLTSDKFSSDSILCIQKCYSFKSLDRCRGDVSWKTVLGDSELAVKVMNAQTSKMHVEILNKMVS